MLLSFVISIVEESNNYIIKLEAFGDCKPPPKQLIPQYSHNGPVPQWQIKNSV